MLRKLVARIAPAALALGLTSCAGAAARADEQPSQSEFLCEQAVDVPVQGAPGWLVADTDGCAGGPAVLRGITARGTPFEHVFATPPGHVDAAFADLERGFVYLVDAHASVVVVHEIARELDRTIAVGAPIDPAALALVDEGLGLRICAAPTRCVLTTRVMRDPATVVMEPQP